MPDIRPSNRAGIRRVRVTATGTEYTMSHSASAEPVQFSHAANADRISLKTRKTAAAGGTASPMLRTQQYGPGFGSDSKANLPITGRLGLATGRCVATSFVPTASKSISHVSVPRRVGATGAGYSAGTGGTWRLSVYSDNAGVPGTLLRSTANFTVAHTGSNSETYPWEALTSSLAVTVGTLYWLVLEDMGATPAVNYASGNYMYYNADPTWSPRQPMYNDASMRVLACIDGATWGTDTSGLGSAIRYTPVFAIRYTDETQDTQAFHEAMWGGAYPNTGGSAGDLRITAGTHRARELFTPASTVQTTGGQIYLSKLAVGDGGDVIVEIKRDSDSVVIATATILDTDIDLHAAGDWPRGRWETMAFGSTITLTGGVKYRLEVRSLGTSVFRITPMRTMDNANERIGHDPGWTNPFEEGEGAQYTTNSGTAWALWYNFGSNDQHLPFSLTKV